MNDQSQVYMTPTSFLVSGVQIGGLSFMAPGRRGHISQVEFKRNDKKNVRK